MARQAAAASQPLTKPCKPSHSPFQPCPAPCSPNSPCNPLRPLAAALPPPHSPPHSPLTAPHLHSQPLAAPQSLITPPYRRARLRQGGRRACVARPLRRARGQRRRGRVRRSDTRAADAYPRDGDRAAQRQVCPLPFPRTHRYTTSSAQSRSDALLHPLTVPSTSASAARFGPRRVAPAVRPRGLWTMWKYTRDDARAAGKRNGTQGARNSEMSPAHVRSGLYIGPGQSFARSAPKFRSQRNLGEMHPNFAKIAALKKYNFR